MTAAGAAAQLPSRRWLGLDWFDWLFLCLVAAWSMMVMGPLLTTGKALSGGDGLFTVDQLQYLAWVRSAGDHVLVGNSFDFAGDHRVFLHPGYLISGLLHRFLGIGLPEAYTALWKPVAVAVTFLGIRQYSRRLLRSPWSQRTAMVIALTALMGWGGLAGTIGLGDAAMKSLDFISSEMWTGQLLMGYEMGAIAVFLVPLVLLAVERAREKGASRPLLLAALGGLVVSWLQPWQGAELALIVVVVELMRRWRRGVPIEWRLLTVVGGCAAPAFYYAAIAATDPSWRLAGEANARGAQPEWSWPVWAIALTLAPLGLPALIALGRRVDDWQEFAVRIWPLAVIGVYLQPFGTFPYHAFQGLTLPLAVLACQAFTVARPGWLPAPKAFWVVPAILLLAVPGTVHRMRLAESSIADHYFPYYRDPGESAALAWLDRQPGDAKVLTDPYGGLLVPAFTGKEAFIGPRSWTPSWTLKSQQSGALLVGLYGPERTRSLITSTGASYIFAECLRDGSPLPLINREIGPLLGSVHRFGCATVYRLRPSHPRPR